MICYAECQRHNKITLTRNDEETRKSGTNVNVPETRHRQPLKSQE